MAPTEPPAAQVPRLHPHSLTSLSLRASGAGASVYHAMLSLPSFPTPVQVAVRKPRITSSLSLLRFESELSLRSTLSHPHILPLLAACTDAPHHCTVSPWMAGGTLFDVLHTQSVRMSFARLLSLSLQFAHAMRYLHARNIVHRDLKTSNLLLDASWTNLMLSDLDLCVDVAQLKAAAGRHGGRAMHRGPSNGRLSHMVGTLVYMAPEVLKGQPHSFAADVYAFAITVNEIAAAAVPYVDRKLPLPELHTVLETRFNEVKLRAAIVKNHLRPSLASGIPPQFGALLQQCWHADPAQRPSFAHIVDFLEAMVAQGPHYLQQFSAATLDAEQLADKSRDLRIDDANPLLDDIKRHAETPKTPVWRARDGSHSPTGFDEMHVESAAPRVDAALSSTCGSRGADRMEDRSIVSHHLAALTDEHLFAVFDGHAGQACAQFAATHFEGALFRAWSNPDATPESALVRAFEDVDAAFLKEVSHNERSGCTALAALVANGRLIVANAGDCRCVMATKNGKAVELSRDHVATDPQERARVQARGGFVSPNGRVQGVLMVSRALGDRAVKRYISSTPEVTTTELTPDVDFFILASDGLWDVVSSQDAVALVRSTVRVPDMAAKRLALKAIELGSDDNVSVIVAFVGGTQSFHYLES